MSDEDEAVDATIRAARRQVFTELCAARDNLKRAVAMGAVAVTSTAARPVLGLLDQAFDQLGRLLVPDDDLDGGDGGDR